MALLEACLPPHALTSSVRLSCLDPSFSLLLYTVALRYMCASFASRLCGRQLQLLASPRRILSFSPSSCLLLSARPFVTLSGQRLMAAPAPPTGGSVEKDEETHPDFLPRAVATEFSEEESKAIVEDINETIRAENVVIFIKGVPEAPMCAFSKKMIDVVECLGLEYTSFDVLAHPVVRSHVKVVSEWPTIPQMFVKGEFVGGLDIILQLAEKGDLQMLLDQKGIKHRDQKLE